MIFRSCLDKRYGIIKLNKHLYKEYRPLLRPNLFRRDVLGTTNKIELLVVSNSNGSLVFMD